MGIVGSDRDYFQKFPIFAVVWIMLSVVLLLISFDFLAIFKFFRETPQFIHWVHYVKNTIASVTIVYFSVQILIYLIKFSPMSKYQKNLSDVQNIFLEEIQKNKGNLLAEFVSFRPWMSDEYYVKINKNYIAFIPLYLVVFYIKDGVLYINEARVKIKEKSYEVAGYHVIPMNIINSISLSQDRILFSTRFGDDSATVYFLEIRTSSGILRIPLYEEEILSRFFNLKEKKEEFINKVMMATKFLFNFNKA